MQKCKIVATGLFIPRGDAAAALEPVEETLDAVAYPVEPLVVAILHFARRVRWDYRLHATRLHGLTDPV